MVDHRKEGAPKGRPGQAEKSAGAKGPGQAPASGERIAKALARAGVASRREVERLIGLGKVAVNGRLLDTAATLVKPGDIVTVDGKVVNEPEPTRLWRYHKPVGLVTTHKDPQDRPTVFQNLPEGLPRVISIGRLDLNSEGLLLLTNDGALSRALEMPATGWVRRYRVRARGRATQAQLDRLQDGITVEGVRYGPIEARLDKAAGEGGANLWLTVSLTEGKNREVRRVLEALGLTVNRLIRLAYGPFQLGTLGLGEVEEVGPRVIRELLADKIAPENLPTGDRVTTPMAAQTRRAATPARPAGARSGLGDPSRKPSKVRAAAEDVARQLAEPRSRAGWAKAAPRSSPHARPGGRDRPRDGDERPARPTRPGAYAKGPPRERREGDERGPRPAGKPGGFAKGSPRPRREGDERAAKPGYKGPPRERGEGDERPRGPRPGGKPGGFGKGPARPGGSRERSDGDRPRPAGGGHRGKPGGGSRSGPKGPPRPGGPRGPKR